MSVQRINQEIQATEAKLRVLQAKLQIAGAMPLHPVGTKFKVTLGPNSYRVAVQTKKGFLQVKVVTDGVADYHEAGCGCIPCSEICLSNGKIPPWRRGPPLKRTLFEDEFHWRDSM